MGKSHPNCICNKPDKIPPAYRMGEFNGFSINHSTQPVVFGHLVVMLKDHPAEKVKSITDIDETKFKTCFDIVYKISFSLPGIVKDITGLPVERIYLSSFNESENWHPHVYIVPRSLNVIHERLGQAILDLPQPFFIPRCCLEELKRQLHEKIPDIFKSTSESHI